MNKINCPWLRLYILRLGEIKAQSILGTNPPVSVHYPEFEKTLKYWIAFDQQYSKSPA